MKPSIHRHAAEWLVTLRQQEDVKLEEWLHWTQQDTNHLDAFEEVETLALELGAWDKNLKSQMVREFAGSSDHPRPLLLSMPLWNFKQHRYAWAAGIAAAVGLSAVLLAWAGKGVWAPAGSFSHAYTTARGENRSVALPDGSHIALGAASRVEVAFEAGARTVKLTEGEAYFNVRHDVQRPFIVLAGKLRIADVGTAFDVRRNAEHVVVTVGEGVIDVLNSSGAGLVKSHVSDPPGMLRVHAGEQIVSDLAARQLSIAKADAHSAGSWRGGHFEFQNEPLALVVANINRYSSREIVVADPAIAALRFTGSVYPDRLENWLDAVRRVFAVRVENLDDRRVMLYGQ